MREVGKKISIKSLIFEAVIGLFACQYNSPSRLLKSQSQTLVRLLLRVNTLNPLLLTLCGSWSLRSLSSGLDSGIVPPSCPAEELPPPFIFSYLTYFYHLLSTYHALGIQPLLRRRLKIFKAIHKEKKIVTGDSQIAVPHSSADFCSILRRQFVVIEKGTTD